MLASVEDPEQPRVKKEKKIKKRSKSKLPQERGSENHHSAEYATRPSPFRHSDKGSMSDDDVKKARRELRRAQKMVQRLAELGLDEHGNELDNYSLLKYPLREFKLRLSDQTAIALNPAVTLFAIVGLVAVVWWSSVIDGNMDDPQGSLAALLEWRSYVAKAFGWFFQSSKAVFVFFLLFLVYRYGHVHLGQVNDKPEFSTISTMAMVFAAGTGPVMQVYGVAESLFHQHGHFFAQAGYRSQDEVDMFAVNMALYSWTFLAWPTFTLVAVATALAVHRFGLPLTFRSCFYPILGAYIWGWMGDVIDGMAIVLMILATVCMLCLSTIQIVTGFTFMGWMGVNEQSTDSEVIMVQQATVWIMTIISIASVMSGLHGGIRTMALASTSIVAVLWLLALCMDDTKYLLNLQVQMLGYHFQYSVFQLNFWTDAFGQLGPGSGRAIDGHAAEDWWMSSWIVFYQAWTVALGCVFGVFVARLCKGRKVWELCVFCWLTPAVACLLWVCVFGGIGIRQARQATELQLLGETYYGNSAHFLADGSDLCYSVPQHDVAIGNATVIFTNRLPGVTPVCQFDPDRSNLASLHVLNSFQNMGRFWIGLYIVGCVVLYVTMSDAASFMVDTLASNGRKNHNHWSRRLFWASAVGVLTTTLLSLGGRSAVKAIESGIIVAALPVAILLCYLVPSITLFCRAADNADKDSIGTRKRTKQVKNDAAAPTTTTLPSGCDPNNGVDYTFPTDGAEFGMPVYGGILNGMEYIFGLGHVNATRLEQGLIMPTRIHATEFVKGLVVPFVSMHQVLHRAYPDQGRTNAAVVACYTICYVGWTVLVLTSGWTGLSATLFVLAGLILATIRAGIRAKFCIRSNVVADIVASLWLWPQVVSQLNMPLVVQLPTQVVELPQKKSLRHVVDNDEDKCDLKQECLTDGIASLPMTEPEITLPPPLTTNRIEC